MHKFNCEECNTLIIKDQAGRYRTKCEHYPISEGRHTPHWTPEERIHQRNSKRIGNEAKMRRARTKLFSY